MIYNTYWQWEIY